ncbi:Hypothetical protein SFBmNL_01308 [Candidatus Arthromitus sp. SFB-mouse-NL]|uniref:DUF4214 domain-containing protein n=1 Tax=Candidatus Arthromitus sp. SFB-mouse-NL TaxID=1508644 RepID=UPI00049B25F0|nr:DUF4214 domain-containing protein [Candidatus Arthromitus sp. SFB-mouse-NL]AID45212.1 Hypothetical protein SFBmNL_01308 [Candidatus Arthromitus sp. SFB-mouse-NL]
MNKKRVALALVAALGMNSLMVTVGAVGGQAFIAHAQDSKLSTDLLDKLKTLEIESLETSVDMSADGKAQVTFTKISPETISNVTGEFEYKPFTERSDLKETASKATGVWDKSTGKFNVSGITAPGIYTGKVTIVYANKMTAEYTLSLVKKPSDSITFDTEVGVGTVKLSNIKFDNGSSEVTGFKPTKVSFSLNGGTPVKVDPDGNGNYVLNLLDLGNKGNLKDTDKLTANFSYGAKDEYTLSSDIVLVKKNQKITNAVASNDKTKFPNIKQQIKTDFGLATDPEIGTYVDATNSYKISFDGKEILTYDQTVSTGDKLGGALLTLTTTGSQVKLSPESATLAKATQLEDNYVPNVMLSYGINTIGDSTVSVGLIGDYTLTINNDTITCLDAMSGLAPSVMTKNINSTDYSYVAFTGTGIGGNSELVTHMTNIDKTQSITLDINKFEHGYNAIPVTFEVDAKDDKSTISTLTASMTGANNVIAAINTASTSEDPVKASIIVSVDLFDGVAVQSKFVKTSSSEGQVTIVGGSKLLNDLVGKLDYNEAVLTIDGVKATVNTTDSKDNNLVFDVQFSGAVPNKTDASWVLEIKGKRVEGKVDLTPGVVESVNLTSVQATNSGTENITDQFKIDAKFNSTVPTGTVRVNNPVSGSDRVTFDQFKSGSNTIHNVVNSGKYQGTYSAGVIANYNPITVLLKADNPTTSSVRLTIDMDFFGNNDLIKNITGGIIYYREYKAGLGANDGWEIAKGADISSSDIKEDPVTKVVTGLNAGKEYEFVVTYSYKEGNSEVRDIYSNIAVATTKPGSSSGSGGTISGGSSSSSSTGSTTVNVTSTNSTKGSTSISVTIPSGVSYTESSANPTPVGFKYKDKNGKIVIETNDQYSNVKARFQNGKVVLEGLVPGKEYTEISINYNDKNNKTKTLVLKNVKIDSTSEGQSYLANVYNVVFNRPADENGYMFHLGNLTSKKVSLRAFLLNMINEKEFDKLYTTAENKVEALYNAIVNRDSDTQGKAFWVAEYKKLLSVYGSSSATLQALADRMVNENELKTLAQKLNFEW